MSYNTFVIFFVEYQCEHKDESQDIPKKSDTELQNTANKSDTDYDNSLVLPDLIKPFISTDRLVEPSSLQHQCRLSIRQALLLADNLPRGIHQLPLPNGMKNCIDLNVD